MRRDVLLRAQSVWVRGTRREVLSPRGAPHLFAAMDGSQRYLYGDAGGFIHLAELAAVASTEREALLWIPGGDLRLAEMPGWEDRRGMGVLLLNHAAGFRPSDWRDARRRLGSPRPCRRQMEIRHDPARPWYDYRTAPGREVDAEEHGGTMVFTGDSRAFRAMAEQLWCVGLGEHGAWSDLNLARSTGHNHHDDVFLCRYTRWRKGPPYHRYALCPTKGDESGMRKRMADAGWNLARRTREVFIFRRPWR